MVTDFDKLTRRKHLRLATLPLLISLIMYFVCILRQPAYAQLCTNPSDQLIINQTFGTVSQPVSITGLTPYRYVPPTCPSDGQYTLTETVAGTCSNYTWYGVPTDHTPDDVDGNMMVVNGAHSAGAFYQQAVSGLCPGTRYELSVWVLNILKARICGTPLVPNLVVTIENNDNQALITETIGRVEVADKPIWQRYSVLFTAPKTTENLVLKLVNMEGRYGCGNDMAVDDIQLRQCEACASEHVYVPDAFSPNNDGLNDELVVTLPNVTSYDLTVFNRWGNVMFASTNATQRWDGTCSGSPCAPGHYTWVISYRSDQGLREQSGHTQSGHVLLIR